VHSIAHNVHAHRFFNFFLLAAVITDNLKQGHKSWSKTLCLLFSRA